MSSFPVTPQDRVEALLHLLCEELFDEQNEVRTLACQHIDHQAGVSVPLQYLLCRLDLPQARAALLAALPAWEQAVQQLAALVTHIASVWAEDARGWAGFSSLLHAPWSVQRPAQPDVRDHDVLLLLERDLQYHGSWDALLEALHQQGSRQNQSEIQRILQLAAFERTYQVNLQEIVR